MCLGLIWKPQREGGLDSPGAVEQRGGGRRRRGKRRRGRERRKRKKRKREKEEEKKKKRLKKNVIEFPRTAALCCNERKLYTYRCPRRNVPEFGRVFLML